MFRWCSKFYERFNTAVAREVPQQLAAPDVLPTIPSEGKLYCLFDSYEDSYESIVIDGFIDSTLEGIHRGMHPLLPRTQSKGVHNGKKRVHAVEDGQSAVPFVRTYTTPLHSTSQFIEPVAEQDIRHPILL